MAQPETNIAALRAELAAIPTPPWRWVGGDNDETTLLAGTTPILATNHVHDVDGCDVDVLFHEVRDGRRMFSGAELADAAGGIDNAVARFTERAPAYVAFLLAALDRVSAVAAALAAEADLNDVGSDEYIALHAAAARVRGAIGAVADSPPDPTTPAGEWPNLAADHATEWIVDPALLAAAAEDRDAHDQEGHDTAGPHHDHTTDPW